MKRRTSIINTVISLILTVACVFVAAYLANHNYYVDGIAISVLFYLIGAVVFGFVNAVIHELGHVIAYKKNNFYLLTVCIWFFKWTRINKKMRFDFTLIGEEAGYTEGVPMGTENIEKRYKSTAFGGILASFIALLIGVGLIFTVGKVELKVYCVLSMMLPVSAYYFFGNALPMINGGAKNDGAVVWTFIKNDDSSKVAAALLKAQAQLFEGKTPGEIDKDYLFSVPQLPEDDLNFISLVDLRYNYYLDIADFDNAKKAADRLYEMVEDMPKNYRANVCLNELYDSCTFDLNEELADDLMYDWEKYLNSYNSATNLRLKLAYYLYVKKGKAYAKELYDLGIKRSGKMPIKGQGIFEEKLLRRMEKDVIAAENSGEEE